MVIIMRVNISCRVLNLMVSDDCVSVAGILQILA